ncbi:proprotein convertase subtilisin/kexin type 5-like [Ruditapes philippinarum]|uniref:proprotein convertase subtilisin/kexin type 5-like n=1 Tax=Ruditapes philippinarum TaxID=129788 RepID=UPI00295B356F|nr:proprotein convertase subtilisin/kexin type 5-like [Ruditapes philippinarum]
MKTVFVWMVALTDIIVTVVIHACSNNCVTCSGVSSCNTCKNGYYIGRKYDDNKYEDDCSLSCPDNCISCTSYYNCSICNDGFYNGRQYPSSDVVAYDCQHACSSNCATCSGPSSCNTCKNGFYIGRNPENNKYTEDCSISCPDTCDLCDNCEVGKNGSVDCVNSCSVGCENKNCTYTGECPRCKERFTGVKCDRCVDATTDTDTRPADVYQPTTVYDTDTHTRQADVNQPTSVYESLTATGVNRFADYSSLELQDVPTLELPNDHTVKLDPGVQYYNVSAK